MSSAAPNSAAAVRQAYDHYTFEAGARNAKVACILVMVLMPIGSIMDRFVYEGYASFFLLLRLMTSALAALVWIGLRQPGLSDAQVRLLSMGWYIVPSFFISWMINATDGFSSTYYAGLNLVILAVSSVIQATLIESIRAVTIIIVMYLSACLLHNSPIAWNSVANNSFFIFCTAAIVITGNYFFNRLRFREFALRYELDENRQKLEESNRKLLQLDELKSRFFANISHELRTPLTLLLAPLETLIHRHATALDEVTRTLLLTMHANGMRLLKLINDLLDLVRLESGIMQVKREPVDLLEFIGGLASAARQIADDKRIQLVTAVAPEVRRVMVDRDKLEKIILNLQFNALKFTPAGGRVEVGAHRENDSLVLQVKDTGMGISVENLPQVFNRFWQADSSSQRRYQGVGIGLALVKELTEIQGGHVSVASQEGKGTTFTVRLPYLEPAPASPEDAVEAQRAPANSMGNPVASQEWLANLYRRAELFPAMPAVRDALRPVEAAQASRLPKLLVADDEPDMLRFLKSQLQDHYQIFEASNGQQAVDKTSQFLPDIVLLDMMMPEKDGLQACREIRQHTPTHGIPVILLTARADEETKLAALSAGANDFLPKPFSTTELHVRVKNLVETYQYQRKLAQQNQILENTVEQLKETETQLVQTEKMASLGRLSAGIIHEINNPLNYAMTGLYTLRRNAATMADSERAAYEETLKDVAEGIQRVQVIITDLRSFTHRETGARDDVNAADLVGAALRLLSREWRSKVKIEQALPPDLTLSANRNRLIQVLINLLQNALDAIEEKTFTAEEPTIRISGETRDGQVTLRIRDNGAGIAAEHLGKIFDPFFTTKEVGKGMGLGLSICYRIVQEYDGHISVRSEHGRFSEFSVHFPVKKSCEAA